MSTNSLLKVTTEESQNMQCSECTESATGNDWEDVPYHVHHAWRLGQTAASSVPARSCCVRQTPRGSSTPPPSRSSRAPPSAGHGWVGRGLASPWPAGLQGCAGSAPLASAHSRSLQHCLQKIAFSEAYLGVVILARLDAGTASSWPVAWWSEHNSAALASCWQPRMPPGFSFKESHKL